MDTSLDHFDEDDLALIAGLNEAEDASDGSGDSATSTNQQAGTEKGASSEQGGQGSADAKAKTDDEQGAGADQEAAGQGITAADQVSHDGNVKAALRAARRAERRALQENDRLKRELEEVRANLPAGANGADGELDDALAQDFPQVAAALKKRDDRISELNERIKVADQAAAVASASNEFVPPLAAPEVQEVIDEIPALLAMQHNPDQTGWKLAIGYDAMLIAHPKWSARSPAERFAEAARLAQTELNPSTNSNSSAQPTAEQQAEAARQKAAAAAAQAGRRQPETLSDFGGAASESQGSNLARFTKMSDSDIEAELLRGG